MNGPFVLSVSLWLPLFYFFSFFVIECPYKMFYIKCFVVLEPPVCFSFKVALTVLIKEAFILSDSAFTFLLKYTNYILINISTTYRLRTRSNRSPGRLMYFCCFVHLIFRVVRFWRFWYRSKTKSKRLESPMPIPIKFSQNVSLNNLAIWLQLADFD